MKKLCYINLKDYRRYNEIMLFLINNDIIFSITEGYKTTHITVYE